MRKLLFGALALVAILLAVNFAKAVSCESWQYEENGVCLAKPSGGDLIAILGSYCKPGVVKYTEWSECDKRFGKNGIQYRSIVYPTQGNCVASTYDQVAQQKDCLK